MLTASSGLHKTIALQPIPNIFAHYKLAPRPGPVCAAGKGFGSEQAPARQERKSANTSVPNTTGKLQGSGRGKHKPQAAEDADSKVVQRAVEVVEGGSVRPVQRQEAAQGRIDYVRNWGSGQPADLGSLEVESFSPGVGASAGASGREAPQDSQAAAAQEALFHVQLARRLGELEAAGELRVVRAEGAAPLPPFERWSFREERYIQWLADMQAAHLTLEAAVADATTVAATEHYGDRGPGLNVFMALERFGEAAGLDRSLEIAADLNNIARSSTLEGPVDLVPTPDTVAYCQYLGQLAALCVEGETLATRCEGALRLLANAYSLHITHLTTGMRIGAAAAEKLDLFPVRALNFYRTWPSAVGKDPLALLLRNVNAAGAALDPKQRGMVMRELKAAFPMISLLLGSLAHEN